VNALTELAAQKTEEVYAVVRGKSVRKTKQSSSQGGQHGRPRVSGQEILAATASPYHPDDRLQPGSGGLRGDGARRLALVVKAQIHAGARGKAGGVKFCRTYHEVQQAARDLLGKRLVTSQTGPEGKPVQRVYVELADPSSVRFIRLCARPQIGARARHRSKHGGMEIEEIAKNTPEELLQVIVEPRSACCRSRRANSRSSSA